MGFPWAIYQNEWKAFMSHRCCVLCTPFSQCSVHVHCQRVFFSRSIHCVQWQQQQFFIEKLVELPGCDVTNVYRRNDSQQKYWNNPWKFASNETNNGFWCLYSSKTQTTLNATKSWNRDVCMQFHPTHDCAWVSISTSIHQPVHNCFHCNTSRPRCYRLFLRFFLIIHDCWLQQLRTIFTQPELMHGTDCKMRLKFAQWIDTINIWNEYVG